MENQSKLTPTETVVVRDAAQLARAVEALEKADLIALDLEFDKNRYRYGFNLCLLQVSTKETCFLIDPMVDEVQIEKLFPVLENKAIQKLVFAFGEDLRLLHSLGCFPKGLYDIKTATNLLDYPPASLTNLLHDIADIDVGKSAQNSNWCLRPLTETQLAYAAEDVVYLPALYQIVSQKVEDKGMTDWIRQENEYAEGISYADVPSVEVYRTKDKLGRTEYNWQIMKTLLLFRETLAEEVNRPGYQIFHKDYLSELAENPNSLKNWERARGIHPKVKNGKIKVRLQEVLQEAFDEADREGYSKQKLAVPRASPTEVAASKREKARIEKIKTAVFVPIKKKLTQDYGENAATFMLSNRALTDVISGDASGLREYKRELLKKIAAEVGVEVSPYLPD